MCGYKVEINCCKLDYGVNNLTGETAMFHFTGNKNFKLFCFLLFRNPLYTVALKQYGIRSWPTNYVYIMEIPTHIS